MTRIAARFQRRPRVRPHLDSSEQARNLKITHLTESPFRGEPRRRKTEFEGELTYPDGMPHFLWGRTREDVIAKAQARKSEYLARVEAMENAEWVHV